MKTYYLLDNSFYTGVALLSDEEAKKRECTLTPPNGHKVDQDNCPIFKKGEWADCSNAQAKAMSAKYHAPPSNPFQ